MPIFRYTFENSFNNELHPTEINFNHLSDSPDGVLNTEAFSDNVAKDFYFSSKDPFNQHSPDMLIPIFMMVEFLAYLGWIKVAESLLNPFGEDDEDFDIDYLIDRNIWVSYMIVDTATDTELEQDPFLQIKEENKVDGHIIHVDQDEDSPMI